MEEILISVIVPVYNVEKYLHRCIDSILAQDFSRFELILVDDGSTDSSGLICDKYKNLDKRVIVVHKENGGLSDARNVGISISIAEYLTFIDSDDWVGHDYLSSLVNLMDDEIDITIGNFIYSSHFPMEIDSKRHDKTIIFTNIGILNEIGGELGIIIVSAWAKLYRRVLFDDIYFPVGRIHEDDFTTYKLLYKARNIALTSKIIYFYWQHSGSITSNRDKIARADKLDASLERLDFFIKLENQDLIKLGAKNVFHSFLEYDKYLRYNNESVDPNIKRMVVEKTKGLKLNIVYRLYFNLYYSCPILGLLIYERVIWPIILKPKYKKKNI